MSEQQWPIEIPEAIGAAILRVRDGSGPVVRDINDVDAMVTRILAALAPTTSAASSLPSTRTAPTRRKPMPEQQPDAVTALAELIYPYVEGERDDAVRAVLASGLVVLAAPCTGCDNFAGPQEDCERHGESRAELIRQREELRAAVEDAVPRAEWRRVGDCATQFKRERDQLRQAVLDLAEHFETRDHLPRWYAGQKLRALAGGGS